MSNFFKIDGTTSKEFYIGKPEKGFSFKIDQGKAAVQDQTGLRILGVDNARGKTLSILQLDAIPTVRAVQEAVQKKMRTVDTLDGVDLEENDYVFLKKIEGVD